jgi:hypothetical protein
MNPAVEELFASGKIVLLIFAFMGVELIVLILVRKKVLGMISPLALVASLSAGAALLLALREALRAAPWQRVALWMIIALGCHLWDLRLRLAAR